MERTEVWRVENAEGDRRLVVFRNGLGMFFWEEEAFTVLDETDEGGGIYEYWTFAGLSGLYDTPEAAREDARKELRWLRANGE